MDKLLKARETITEADREITCLFEKRMEAVRLVAEYKKEKGLPVFDSLREAEVIKNNLSGIEDEEIKKLYLPFIKSTIEISKRFQHCIVDSIGDNIILERGAISKASDVFKIKGKVLIVTDSGVPEIYSRTVVSQFPECFIFTFPEGEQSKSLDTYKAICEKLLELSFTRRDAVIAVGGGVTGDMAGFAAATYMRGIAFYNIPTTLLSQVDSSIGGKTAIDLDNVKNVVGAFYQPEGVIIDPDVLDTLPERHIKNGLAESIKMSLCFNKELFEIFKADDYMKHIDRIIELSLKIKNKVVKADEKEADLRKSLNFGHTIGHAVESLTCGELLHGECVALGMLPMCGDAVRNEVRAVLENVGLPTAYPFDKQKLREKICHDKKSLGDKISVVKCDKIGSFYFEEMTAEDITNLI